MSPSSGSLKVWPAPQLPDDSAYRSSSRPNARESRISSQRLLLVFSIRRWSWPLELFACWVFYQLLCLVLMGILEKRAEHELKWGRVLCFLIDFVPQSLSQLSTAVMVRLRASAHEEKRFIWDPNFRGAKPRSTGLRCFRSAVRLYFMAQARGRRKPVTWWVRKQWGRREWLGD